MNKKDPEDTGFDLAQADAVLSALSQEPLSKTAKAMASNKDSDDLINHPLRRQIMVEFGEDMAASIGEKIRSGVWSPQPAYFALISKNSGAYREVCFPPLLDALVARRLTDELDTFLKNKLDKNSSSRAFYGRNHTSLNRHRGDYSDWFQVWQDYSARIETLANEDGLNFFFETDISDFFLSVDRNRAREAIARRTGVTSRYLDLLFACLEAWVPKFYNVPSPGLPTDPNGISRLVAHLFMMDIDDHFQDTNEMRYLRYVDDTVIFLKNQFSALSIMQEHYLSLRALGLKTNANKTKISKVDEYVISRHREMNLRITNISSEKDLESLAKAVEEWYAKDHHTIPSWDRISRRLYSTASQLGSTAMKNHVIADITSDHRVVAAATKYAKNLNWNFDEVHEILSFAVDGKIPLDTSIHSLDLMNCIPVDFSEIQKGKLLKIVNHFIFDKTDKRVGVGYAKASAIYLALKLSDAFYLKNNEAKLFEISSSDSHLTIATLYTLLGSKRITPERAFEISSNSNSSDILYCISLMQRAHSGTLNNVTEILNIVKQSNRQRTFIPASQLPLLAAICDGATNSSQSYFNEIKKFLQDTLNEEKLDSDSRGRIQAYHTHLMMR